jgi:hypothetical protein
MFVGSSFRAAFLEPKEVGSLAKVLVESVMPVFFRTPRRIAVLLPKKIGALTKDVLQAVPCTFQDVSIIPVGSQRSTPRNMHLCREGLDIVTGHKLRVGGQLQCRFYVSFVRCGPRILSHDRKGVEDGSNAAQHIN